MGGGRGAYVLWPELCRLVPARCRFCRQDPERHKARGPASRAADKVRVCDQSADGEAHWPDNTARSVSTGDQNHSVGVIKRTDRVRIELNSPTTSNYKTRPLRRSVQSYGHF